MDYRKEITGDVRIIRKANQIRKTGATKELYQLGKMVGNKAAEIIESELGGSGSISFDEAKAVVSHMLKAVHGYMAELSSACVNKQYEDAGIGLKAVIPEYNTEAENRIAKAIADRSTANEPG